MAVAGAVALSAILDALGRYSHLLLRPIEAPQENAHGAP